MLRLQRKYARNPNRITEVQKLNLRCSYPTCKLKAISIVATKPFCKKHTLLSSNEFKQKWEHNK